MLNRIQKAIDDGIDLSDGQQNYMTHELAEKALMDKGMVYDEAHSLAMQTHPFGRNYDADLLTEENGFNSKWREAWGDR